MGYNEKSLIEDNNPGTDRLCSTTSCLMQLLDGVQETLEYLSVRHDLVLLTKGDLEEQKLKVERSGIEKYFRQVVIVEEKEVATYHRIVSELEIDPQQTWMVGNSPRSDIN